MLLTHSSVGENGCDENVCVVFCACSVLRLVLLVFREVVREKEDWPTGCLPRAFSLILRDCSGRDSSMMLVEALAGLEMVSMPSSSSSSSSPIANVSSSGTLRKVGDLMAGRVASREALRDGVLTPVASPASFRSLFWRSSSSRAPLTVKSRRASKRLRAFTTTSTKRRFSARPSQQQRSSPCDPALTRHSRWRRRDRHSAGHKQCARHVKRLTFSLVFQQRTHSIKQ